MLSQIDKNPFYSQIKSIVLYLLSTIAVTLIISIGLVASTQISGYHLQNMYFPVQKDKCTCDCWDGFFRGVYGRGGYKFFYFNYEKQTIIIFSIIIFYCEIFRQTLLNMFLKRQINLILLIPSIYANFYGAWSIINYVNDQDYDRMLKSQIFFSITELITGYIFYQCLLIRNKNEISLWNIYILSTISSLHIILALRELNFEQFGRNFTLMLSDFINLIWIGRILIKNPRLRPNRQRISIWFIVLLCLWLFYQIVCQYREKPR